MSKVATTHLGLGFLPLSELRVLDQIRD
jgi:hypothetical protein